MDGTRSIIVSRMASPKDVQSAELDLKLESFSVSLISHLAKTLEDVVGLEDASGFITVVGQRMGRQINDQYKQGLSLPNLSKSQVAEVLVNLKQRINGQFSVVEQDDDKIVLRNQACPFGEAVIGRESLCMMTTNVFGTIAADNLGYARVVLNKTIARGDGHCLVTIYLKPPTDNLARGRDFFGSP